MKIVFFDGYCSLCNGVVNFLMKLDHKNMLRFASLQGETAKRNLPENLRGGPSAAFDTLVFFDDGAVYLRSTAVLKITASLGGFYRVASLGLLIPLFLRDGIYRLVARYRYRLFGKRETCRIPSPAEAASLLP
jgi:predicted DCC family thiol-disulfide oxidoreductase YuxK